MLLAAPLAVNRRQATGLFQGRSRRAARRDGDAVGQLCQLEELSAVSAGVVRPAGC